MITGGQGNPYAPPQARVEDVHDASAPLELASLGARLGGAILDVIVLLAVVVPVFIWLDWANDDPSFAESARDSAFSFAVFLAFNAVLLIRRGQTIGKLLVGTRIVRTDGSRAGAARLIGLRYGIGSLLTAHPVYWLVLAYAALDSLLIFRASRKCLHDTIADTIVVRA